MLADSVQTTVFCERVSGNVNGRARADIEIDNQWLGVYGRNYQSETDSFDLVPGQEYTLVFDADNEHDGTINFGFSFDPPLGYEVLINGGEYINSVTYYDFAESSLPYPTIYTVVLREGAFRGQTLGMSLSIQGYHNPPYNTYEADIELNGLTQHMESSHPQNNTPPGFTNLIPNQEYILTLTGGGSISGNATFEIDFVLPDGFELFVDGEKKSIHSGSYDENDQLQFSVVLHPKSEASAPYGDLVGIDVDPALWSISLGSLPNGKSAGSVDFMHVNPSLELIEELRFSDVQTEVEVLRDQLVLKQIRTDQMLLDIVENGPNNLSLNFYDAGSVGPLSQGFYTFSGSPTISYSFLRNSGGVGYALTRSEGSRSQIYDFDGTLLAYPNSLKSVEKNIIASNASFRTRDILLKDSVGTTNYSSSERHDFFSFGKRLTSRTNSVAGTQYEQTFSYQESYTPFTWDYPVFTSPDWGSYGRVSSIQSPSGAITTLSYSNDNDSVGNVVQTSETYLDGQTVTRDYNYANDWNGSKSLLASATRSEPLAQSLARSHDYNGYSNNEPLNETLLQDADDEEYAIEYYRHHLWDTVYVDLPHASTAKDGKKLSHMYQEGVYEPSSNEFRSADWDETTIYIGSQIESLDEDEEDNWTFYVSQPGRLICYTTGDISTYGKLYNDSGSQLASDYNSGEGNNYRIEYDISSSGYYKIWTKNYDNEDGYTTIHVELDTDISDNVSESTHWRETRFHGWNGKTSDPGTYEYQNIACSGYRDDEEYFYDDEIENGFGAIDEDDDDDKYFRVDLGVSKFVANLYIAGRGDVNGTNRSYHTWYAKIQKSDNGSSWTTVHDFGSTKYEYGVNVPINDTARYWRLYKEEGDGDLFVTEFRLSSNDSYEDPSQLTSIQNKDVSPIWLAPNKSFKEVIIRDKAGYTIRTETHIYTGETNGEPQFELLTWSDIENDATGNTTRVEKSTGEIQTWEYTDGLMTAHVDAIGKRTEFQHDALERVIKIIQKGAPAYGTYLPQADIVTDLTYNALDQVLTKTVTGGSEPSLSWSWEYDTMGRLTSETVPGPLTTTYQYTKESNGSITLITTLPNGSISRKEHFKDGTVKEITGSAVVDQYINPDGDEVTTNYGSPTSNIQSTITFDSLYRNKTSEGSSRVRRKKNYDEFGRLISEKPDGQLPSGGSAYDQLPSTYYAYNTYGELASVAHGKFGYSADPFNYGLQSSDFEHEFEKIGNDWWKVERTYTYPEQYSDRILTSESKTRVGGCSCGSTFESRSYDIHGNETIKTVESDPANRIRRTIIDAPGTSEDIETIEHNGLTVERKSATGTVVYFEYDDLRRPTATIDPRKGASLTAYDAIGRVDYREDSAGNRTTYTYDSEGRVASVEAPDGTKTYYEYNDRNQVTSTWGSKSQPVRYSYDEFGRRTQITQYIKELVGSGSAADPFLLLNESGTLDDDNDTDSYNSIYMPQRSGTIRAYTLSAIDTYGDLRVNKIGGDNHVVTNEDSGENKNFFIETHVTDRDRIDLIVKRRGNYGGSGYQPYQVIIEFIPDDPTEEFTKNYYLSGKSSYVSFYYSPYTGLLESKEIGGETVATYSYDDVFRVETLTNGRDQITTYGYDPDHNSVSSITYSDGTPSIGITRDRLGNITSVTDSAGTHDFTYDYASTLQLQHATLPYASGMRLTPTYASSGPVIGRMDGFGFGTSSDPDAHHQTTYGFDTYGRLGSVAGAADNGSLRSFDYGYLAESNLVSSINQASSGFVRNYAYDPERDLLATIDNLKSSASIARHDYRYDDVGRRTDVTKTGSMYSLYGSTGLVERYDYNTFGELTSATSYLGSDPTATLPALAGRSFQFGYDMAGNRVTSVANGASTAYDTENGNQYYDRQVPRTTDVYGADDPAAAVTIDGQAASRANEYFHGQATTATTSSTYVAAAIQSVFGGSTQNQTSYQYLDAADSNHYYDDDGNPTSDDRFTYTFDINNRLIEIEDKAVNGDPNLRNRILQDYDYLGRRWQKRVFEYSGGSWNQTEGIKYVYAHGSFNLVAELDGMNSDAVIRTYTWGKDLSGSLNGARSADSGPSAGGVGGLLMVTENGTDHIVSYDGNGNVVALTNANTGELSAAYEYSPYGRLLRSEGPMAEKNPFKFSTKYLDTETGLYYYGLRYYDPHLGRFINRDPIEEAGGLNLYAAFGNDPINKIDYLGMCAKPNRYEYYRYDDNDAYDEAYKEYLECKRRDIWHTTNDLVGSGQMDSITFGGLSGALRATNNALNSLSAGSGFGTTGPDVSVGEQSDGRVVPASEYNVEFGELEVVKESWFRKLFNPSTSSSRYGPSLAQRQASERAAYGRLMNRSLSGNPYGSRPGGFSHMTRGAARRGMERGVDLGVDLIMYSTLAAPIGTGAKVGYNVAKPVATRGAKAMKEVLWSPLSNPNIANVARKGAENYAFSANQKLTREMVTIGSRGARDISLRIATWGTASKGVYDVGSFGVGYIEGRISAHDGTISNTGNFFYDYGNSLGTYEGLMNDPHRQP